MLNNQQRTLINYIMIHFKSKKGLKTITEEDIKAVTIKFNSLGIDDLHLDENELDEVIEYLQTKLEIQMDRGVCIKAEDHKPWYYNEKKNIEGDYWNRYSHYLSNEIELSPNVINALDSRTDDLMDLLGNPKSDADFQRRGLVIGDVQSGKTSTYIALINKAADAGYKVVILLTGTIEKLRRQTQDRVDNGFLGFKSGALNKDSKSTIGVGLYDKSKSCIAMTSTKSDFNTTSADKIGMSLSDTIVPLVFVLKKNKTILEKLNIWLRSHNLSANVKKIDYPMILIDDEADNASISTAAGEDPTTINKLIREILQSFSKTSYVGFTATPFANIFIHPDTTEEMLGDDLFPRDFIYALEAPSNYIGADCIFTEDGTHRYMLKTITDCEDYIPLKHKKSYQPPEELLPQSLKTAIASFLITNVIRDLRHHDNTHRTMMINISIYIDVQKQIAEHVENFLRDAQRTVKNYYKIDEDVPDYPIFKLLKKVYDTHFKNIGIPWKTIKVNLYPSIAPIVVKFINGGNASKNLNYEDYDETGLRLIAIGGYSLSRGLTLEGLSTSYLYRNTKMYDTLMQMGRWFGYRPNYNDLCQIWMNADARDWYEYITMATNELKLEINNMSKLQRTPSDFGLSIRSDNPTLLITASNKMRSAENYECINVLSGHIIETPYLSANIDVINDNLNVTKNFIKTLLEKEYTHIYDDPNYAIRKKHQFLNVPQDLIIDYLKSYNRDPLNIKFDNNKLISILSEPENSFTTWDILIASGDGASYTFHEDLQINCAGRSFAFLPEYNSLQMSKSKSRLGSKGDSRAGLLKSTVKSILDKIGTKSYSDAMFFSLNYLDTPRNPLLIIYPIEPKYSENDPYNNKTIKENLNVPLIGLCIGYPEVKGRKPAIYKYKINIVKQKELYGIKDEPQEIDDTIAKE